MDNNGNSLGTVSFQVGDPEWIGVLERPDLPYGPDNPFVARFAFIALPVGNSLDSNAIHNQVFDENNANPTVNPANDLPVNATKDFFFRNQGVGSWELNLAAFLADLNTNEWGQIIGSSPGWYQYNEASQLSLPNVGAAFDDARALLAWRYANEYNSLATANNLFGLNGLVAFTRDLMVTATAHCKRPRRVLLPTGNVVARRGPARTTRTISLTCRRICSIPPRRKPAYHRRQDSSSVCRRPAMALPPTTATRFTGCFRNSARTPRRNPAR